LYDEPPESSWSAGKPKGPERRKAMALVAGGASLRGAAKLVGVNGATVRGWARTDWWKQGVARLRARAMDRAAGKLSRAIVSAVDVMDELAHTSEDDQLRLRAAQAVVDTTLRVRAMVDTEQRIAELELAVKQAGRSWQ
jgi:transposase